jgi:hypothetical protein
MRSREISANSSFAERKQNCRPQASLPKLLKKSSSVGRDFSTKLGSQIRLPPVPNFGVNSKKSAAVDGTAAAGTADTVAGDARHDPGVDPTPAAWPRRVGLPASCRAATSPSRRLGLAALLVGVATRCHAHLPLDWIGNGRGERKGNSNGFESSRGRGGWSVKSV